MAYTTVVAGTTITAAWGNGVRDQQVSTFATPSARNSAITAPVEGMLTYQNDENSYTTYSGSAWTYTIYPAHGANLSWTPVITQSNTPTLTNTYSRYARFGRRITFEAVVNITSAGTASNDVVISLPVAMNFVGATVIGTGQIQDNSASLQYGGELIATGASAARIANSGVGTTMNTYYGSAGFTAALASGDWVKVSGHYEAAADS